MPMNAPYAVEPLNYRPGEVVRKLYNGRDATPYVGVVVRVDTACNKVDVEWPMGTEREAPEMLIKENPQFHPPHAAITKMQSSVEERLTAKVAHAGELKRAELEEAARTLLMAGYGEEDALKLLMDGYKTATSNSQVFGAWRKATMDLETRVASAHYKHISCL